MNLSYKVVLIDRNESFICKASESILSAMEHAKVKPFPSGCKGGGCGICKMKLVEGSVRMGAVSREHLPKEQESQGMILACKAYPLSDLKIKSVDK